MGEVRVQRHTNTADNCLLFSGPNPVGIGISGTLTDTGGVMNDKALAGGARQIFTATLHKLTDAD